MIIALPAVVGPVGRIGRVFDDSVRSGNCVEWAVNIGVGSERASDGRRFGELKVQLRP